MLRRFDQLRLTGGRVQARAQRWPRDPSAAQLQLLDLEQVPSATQFDAWLRDLGRQGISVVRTGAMTPYQAAEAEEAGMRCVQQLALLEANPPFIERGSSLRTRPMRRSEHGALAEIDVAAFGELWGLDDRSLRQVCSATPTYRARVVVDPSSPRTPIGFLICGAHARVGYVQRLAVHPDHQRLGAARALLDDALAWFRELDATEVYVNTHVENDRALALYASYGFSPMLIRLQVCEIDLRVAVDA